MGSKISTLQDALGEGLTAQPKENAMKILDLYKNLAERQMELMEKDLKHHLATSGTEKNKELPIESILQSEKQTFITVKREHQVQLKEDGTRIDNPSDPNNSSLHLGAQNIIGRLGHAKDSTIGNTILSVMESAYNAVTPAYSAGETSHKTYITFHDGNGVIIRLDIHAWSRGIDIESLEILTERAYGFLLVKSVVTTKVSNNVRVALGLPTIEEIQKLQEQIKAMQQLTKLLEEGVEMPKDHLAIETHHDALEHHIQPSGEMAHIDDVHH